MQPSRTCSGADQNFPGRIQVKDKYLQIHVTKGLPFQNLVMVEIEIVDLLSTLIYFLKRPLETYSVPSLFETSQSYDSASLWRLKQSCYGAPYTQRLGKKRRQVLSCSTYGPAGGSNGVRFGRSSLAWPQRSVRWRGRACGTKSSKRTTLKAQVLSFTSSRS